MGGNRLAALLVVTTRVKLANQSKTSSPLNPAQKHLLKYCAAVSREEAGLDREGWPRFIIVQQLRTICKPIEPVDVPPLHNKEYSLAT